MPQRLGRPCSVCAHERAADISRDLVHGVSYRAIGRQYGVALGCLSRHVAEHIQAPLRRIIQAETNLLQDAQTVEPTLREMRRLNQRALRILALAEHAQDHDTALHAIAECRRNLELIARLTGELDPQAAGEGSSQGLIVNVVYQSATKPLVGEAPKVIDAAPLPEPASSNFGRSEHP
jgi:hypothetical protein